MFFLNGIALLFGYLWLLVFVFVFVGLFVSALANWIRNLLAPRKLRRQIEAFEAKLDQTQPINTVRLNQMLDKTNNPNNDWFFDGQGK